MFLFYFQIVMNECNYKERVSFVSLASVTSNGSTNRTLKTNLSLTSKYVTPWNPILNNTPKYSQIANMS